MMVNIIMIFLMVLSTIYTLRYVVEFLIKFFSDEPSVIKLNKVETVFVYIAVSYIITFLIT